MSCDRIVFAIATLSGGGAEHVVFQLANWLIKQGRRVELLVTNQFSDHANTVGLDAAVPCSFIKGESRKGKTGGRLLNFPALAVCSLCEKLRIKTPDVFVKASFKTIYRDEIQGVREFFKTRKDSAVVGFLHPTDQLLMFALRGTGIPLFVSERADPKRYFKTRYASYFLRKFYSQLSGMAFQTRAAQDCYPKNLVNKSVVIPNPIPGNLPEPYDGVRRKIIVNYSRISPQKNPFLLADAFDVFVEHHPDYRLEFIGDGVLKNKLLEHIACKKHGDRISVLPHRDALHQSIRDYSIFVLCSDYEGMSNSMLESLAIGLPTICTDCPIGGAAYIIKDHENGILVPIQDTEALAKAMAEVADNMELAQTISRNGRKIRNELSIDQIGQAWLALIEGEND